MVMKSRLSTNCHAAKMGHFFVFYHLQTVNFQKFQKGAISTSQSFSLGTASGMEGAGAGKAAPQAWCPGGHPQTG